MCGRFTLKTPESTVISLFPDLQIPALAPRYNIAPTQLVSCVRQDKSDRPKFSQLRWGLVPFWAKDLKMGARMINARSETVAEKPSFRNAFKKRRCLIFADGYFEWKKIGAQKQPYYITTKDDMGFCMAGLWESWTNNETDDQVETCTILTTVATPSLFDIHDRMPVVVPRESFEFWMDNEFQDHKKLKTICQSNPDDLFKFQPVNKVVNNARNDSPSCIEIIELNSDEA